MDISGKFSEIQNLTEEIERLSKTLKRLRLQKQAVEQEVIAYLKKVKQPGIKKGDIILLQSQKVYGPPKKKRERESDGINVLKNHGVDKPDEVLTEVVEAMKGKKKVVTCLKIKNARD